MNNDLSFLNGIIEQESEVKKLISAIDGGALPAVCTGLSSVHKSLICSILRQKLGFGVAVIAESEAEAHNVAANLRALGNNTLLYPYRDLQIGGTLTGSGEYEHKRIDTLSALADGDFDVVVMSLDASLQLTLPLTGLKNCSFTLETGDIIQPAVLCEKLADAGYVRSETVEGAGQFAARGGIVDFFAVDAALPVRIEFFGDEIDTLSFFDTETQRRGEALESITVAPAGETVFSPQKLCTLLKEYLENNQDLSDVRQNRIRQDIAALENGGSFSYDRYINLIYPGRSTVFDYLENALIVVLESSNIFERLKNISRQNEEDMLIWLENGYISGEDDRFYLTASEFYQKTEKAVVLDNFARSRYEYEIKELLNINAKRSTAWNGDLETLVEDIRYTAENGGSVIVLSGEEKAGKALADDLREKGIFAVYNSAPEGLVGGVTVTKGSLTDGFEFPEIGFMLVSCRRIAAEEKKKARKVKNGAAIGSLDELKAGDAVVHVAHGIGIFSGIQQITNGGITKDYIKIRYAGQDNLYVPVTQLDLVSRYIGADSDNVKLHKLGGSEWHKTRSRVRKAVKDMAKQLTALYAKRMATPGYAFSPDTDLQSNFELRFPYEETEDQLRCVNEIKADMERPVPMDRLLCGDVGFGKTEVALRAAFKCICEGKQCALLVPTTILAWQHYNTAHRRLGELPVTLKLLSRFVPPKQQEKIVKDIACGRVDMVIGTHRLISKDVTFKDLGLVIIDEEQRFGVAQKERLKELYPNVDVLTLSATPIPRTLNMAMSGLRDMSTIEEAPGERHPVQTYVLEHNNGMLYDAMRKELRRGGQVYYLHNRIGDIEKVAARIKTNIPEARIGVAHGQMGEEKLSDVWKQLVEKEIDILVCTTIIETGVDVPNANTLIIEDADRMGLSQLHQLRGRVGRSARRAYAYFCFRGGKQINEDAAKRLEAIRQFTEFGSGFKIAMRDLEIRGAGSILGGAQHGNMEAVGYDMYLKLLAEAMENGEDQVNEKEDNPCTVDLNISAHIPEDYIESLSSRLGIYKRIADIKNDDDVSDVIDELCDRFGDPPRAVMGLIDIALLRNKAAALGIYEIIKEGDDVVLRQNNPDSSLFLKLGAVFGDRARLRGGEKPYVTVRVKKGQLLVDAVSEIVSAL